MNVVGIMNGTSIDGVDFVLCSASDKSFRFRASSSVKFPPLLRKRLVQAAENKMSIGDLAILHNDLGSFYAKTLQAIKTKKKWKFHLVGMHGQTVFHDSGRASLQIGEPSYVQQKLNVPVVSDFRSADIAAGGEGAPLACIFHRHLKELFQLNHIAFHNLGGISNLTYFYSAKEISFDTGPANLLMDLYCQKYLKKAFDRNGQVASKGLQDAKLIQQMMRHPYFKKKAPKTCGREEFGESFFKKYERSLKALGHANALATLSHFTAFSIAKAYKDLLPKLPDEILFSGGGAKNQYLLDAVAYYLPEVEISTTKEISWEPQHIEAAAFAYLAYACYQGKAVDSRNFTGAKNKVVLGKITK